MNRVLSLPFVLALVVVSLFGWTLYAKAAEGGSIYGPLPCSACRLETPMPGPGTKTFLEAWALDMRHRFPFTQIIVEPKDQIVVCNGSYCVTYTMTDSNSYLGGQATPQTSSPGGDGGNAGGGGSGGAGGGIVGGGGCYGNCGNVGIGPISNPGNGAGGKPQEPPRIEDPE